ncbi:MAG: ATP synthase F0 subunit B [Dissulfurispiraceae bacterium]|jgi:F-type H+-transporting ATPase subunit b|nr:ATP synthase F0 subunit B [Dissulfurispiraceae bacterium]
MLEFNSWFFVLLANFLFLIFILNIILFKPLARILKQRQDAINDSLQTAKEMNSKKEDALARMNAELQQARISAREAYNALREQGLSSQKDAVSKAESEAMGIIDAARAEIRIEAEKARAALRADIDRFSEEIVNKLVKV